MTMQFDGNITLGNIIEIAILAGGWIITITSINSRLKTVEANQEKHDVKLENLSKITNMQARFDERMSAIRRDLDDLKRGRGFIKHDVEGEYTADGKRE